LRESDILEPLLGDLADDVWETSCIALSFMGLAIRCMVIAYAPRGTSGRTTKTPKAQVLNTTGIYSLVRHPLYLGNFVITLGLALFIQVWWLVALAVAGFWLYYERIALAEEEFLQSEFGDSFLLWAERTPAFIPRLSNWQHPDSSFSLKKVLRAEYSGFFGIVASFTFLEVAGDLLTEGTLELDPAWGLFFLVGLGAYLAVRTLKKKTRLLSLRDN